jgi:hypothetical protein
MLKPSTHNCLQSMQVYPKAVSYGVLGLLLYLLYTADLPTSPESTTVTFADDTAVVAMDSDPAIALQKLQADLRAIRN